jgi:DNA primase
MDDRFLEDLKNRTDIVEVIRKYTELKKSGKNYMGRSPFRNERTPSFCVSPDKQFWYDFGTSEGGDAISFLEKIENMSFREAIETLADIQGIEVPKNLGKENVSREQKKDIFALHNEATKYFQAQLEKNSVAKEYLIKERKFSSETIKTWRLGYGGDTTDGLTKYLFEKGYSASQISESGVAFERDFGDKKMKDRFSGRIMIPIFEARNSDIIAFSGRKLNPEQTGGKYVNSPENPVYHKSATLFGLHAARNSIREKDAAILVEGNFDVISSHAAGFENVVATCGTSLTEDHLRLLKRLTQNIHLAFDADLAGKQATLRSVEMCLKMELNPFIIDIVSGKDLDDLAQNSPTELKKTIESASPALEFLLERFTQKLLNGTLDGEKKLLDAFFSFLKWVPRPIEVDSLLNQLSQKVKHPRPIIDAEFKKFCAAQREKPKFKDQPTETQKRKFTDEEHFIGFLGTYWELFQTGVKARPEDFLAFFSEETPKEILRKKLLESPLSEIENKEYVAWIMETENVYGEFFSEENQKKVFQGFIQKLKTKKEKQQRIEAAKRCNELLGICG